MSETSKIQWTDATHNFWRGCTKVSPGCEHCYAEARANRFGEGWGPKSQRIRLKDFEAPLRWNEKPWVCNLCGVAMSVAEGFEHRHGTVIPTGHRPASVACFVKQLGAFPICDNANMFDWPEDAVLETNGACVASCLVKLKDKKGGSMNEWPEQLRVREIPMVASK